MKSKKAQLSYLRALIIAIVFVLFLFPFASKIGEEAKEQSRLTLCKASVEANAQAHVHGIDFSKAITCPTKDLTIKTKDQNKIKKQLADEMVECWDIFKQGQADLFTGEGVFCAVCSRIDFTANKPIEGFTEYIYETKPPQKDQTYIEYLGKSTSGEMFLKQEDKQQLSDTIKPENTYAIIFFYAKGRDKIQKFVEMQETKSAQLGLIAGGGVIVATGAAFSLSIVGAPVGFILVGVGGAIIATGQIISWFTTPDIDEWLAQAFLLEYTEETFNNLGCEYLLVEQS